MKLLFVTSLFCQTYQEPETSESSEQSPGSSPLASQWLSIIKSLNELHSTLTENFV